MLVDLLIKHFLYNLFLVEFLQDIKKVIFIHTSLCPSVETKGPSKQDIL